jgi:uncharacterized protein YuzE
MKVSYDQRTDSLTVVFKDEARVAISDDGEPGAVLGFDDGGDLVAIEILNASRRVSEAGSQRACARIGIGRFRDSRKAADFRGRPHLGATWTRGPRR